MYKTKVIQYLQKFSKSELKEFSDFVQSPYFNKHEKTKQLLGILLKLPKWDESHLKKSTIFKQLFPDQAYKEQLLSNNISYLLRLIRRFLIQKQSEQSILTQQLNLIEAALNQEQQNLFELSSKKTEKVFKDYPFQDSNYHLHQNRFNRLQDDYDLKFGARKHGDYLGLALDHFEYYFIGEKLKMTCQMLARRQVMGSDYSYSFLNELLNFIESNQERFSKQPAVWMYYLIYKMMTEKDHQFYFDLKHVLKEQVLCFEHLEGRDIYTHALNYCIGQLNLGETRFRKESFELYQQMLANERLFIDEVLHHWDYTNIVALGCELGAFEWINDFIKNQQHRLPKAEKENTYTYNLAVTLYYQKEYDEAIGLLQQVEFTEVYYNFLTRILMLKIYFDNQDWQALDSSLETFRIYLLRNQQIGESRRKSGLNLIRFTKRLIKIMELKTTLAKSNYSNQLTDLKSKVEEQAMVLNRSWILQKIDKQLGKI